MSALKNGGGHIRDAHLGWSEAEFQRAVIDLAQARGWLVDGSRRCDYQSEPGAPPCDAPPCRNCGVIDPPQILVGHPDLRDYCPEHAKAAL